MTDIRWDGIGPEIKDRASVSQRLGTRGKAFVGTESCFLDPCRLEYGRKLLSTPELWVSEYPAFRVEAFFSEKEIAGAKWDGGLTVPETLDDCLVGVELVLGHFKAEYGNVPAGHNLGPDSR